jgi:beta-lactamase regulating signal transducer with metallopeptidase domain
MSIWLCSFLLHSTLWFSLAWLATRLLPRMHPQTRETVWYTAIAISLLTPSIQLLAPDSLTSLWQLTLPGALFPSAESGLGTGEHGAPLQAGRFGISWEVAFLGVWVSIAGALLIRYLTRILVFRKRLARQDVAVDSSEWVMLTDLSRRAGLSRTPRLTESDHLGSPIAIGVGHFTEICVPTRALHELEWDEFTAMLGHEIAHHQRRDPVRLGLMNLLRSLFFFQPLFSLAGRNVLWAAEEQCDALAAEHVQDRFAVARCLTKVAGWVLPRERRIPVVGMAGGRSHLVQRVDRLIDDQSDSKVRHSAFQRFWSISVLAVAPLVAPGLVPEGELSHRDQESGEPEVSEYSSERLGRAYGTGSEHQAEPAEDSHEARGEHSDDRAEAPEASGGEHGEG